MHFSVDRESGHVSQLPFILTGSSLRGRSAFLATLLLLMAGQPVRTLATEDESRSPDQTIQLFNHRDLAGWSPYLKGQGSSAPNGVFSVRDGQLRISGEVDGYLSTHDSWKDYRLIVEFRWGNTNRDDRQGKARDSGLFLHSIGPDGNSFDAEGAYKAAIECQIMEGAVGDFLLIRGTDGNGDALEPRLTTRISPVRDEEDWPFFHPCGQPFERKVWGRINHFGKSRRWTDTFNFAKVGGAANPWHRVECVCAGDRICVYVDGKLVNAAWNVFPNSGPILLQSEGSEIFFRKIELQPLRNDRYRPSRK